MGVRRPGAPVQPLKFAARSRSEALLLYFGAGLLAFLVLLAWIAASPGPLLHPGLYGPAAFGMLHLDVLGWITTVMFGAYLNLIPVILHPARVSARLARWLLGPHVLGVTGLVAGFALGAGWLLALGATFLVASVGTQAGHLAWATWVSAETSAGGGGGWRARGRRIVEMPSALAFMLAPLFLLEVAVLGFLMAVALGAPGWVSGRILLAAPVHMAAGIGGWLGLTVMGAAYRLVPLFFATKRGFDFPSYGTLAITCVAISVLAAQAAALRPSSLTQSLFDGMFVFGLLQFFRDIFRMIRHRSHGLGDSVTLLTLAAFVNLLAGIAAWISAMFVAERSGLPGGGAGVAVAGTDAGLHAALVLAALYLALFAAPSTLILGQLSRILVFLSTLDLAEWARDHGGVRQTWNLSRPRLMRAGYGVFQAGVVIAVVAMVTRAAGFGMEELLRIAAILQAVGGALMCAALLPPFLVRRQLRPDAAWLREGGAGR